MQKREWAGGDREGIPLSGQTMQKKSPEVSHRSRETITNQLQLDWPHIKNRMRNTSVALLAQPRPLAALPCPPPTAICFWQLFQKKKKYSSREELRERRQTREERREESERARKPAVTATTKTGAERAGVALMRGVEPGAGGAAGGPYN